jgi:hypothetical protein
MFLIVLTRRVRIPFPRWTELVPPYAIGTIAMFWVIERLTALRTDPTKGRRRKTIRRQTLAAADMIRTVARS